MMIQVVDLLLWLFLAVSVVYVFVFAIASALGRRTKSKAHGSQFAGHNSRFLVLYPAYKEDVVIRKSVETFLKQDYPRDKYQLVVISDHQGADTNLWLSQQPVTLLQPDFEKSSKAKALQFAMAHCEQHFDYVVILDADNVVAPDFLSRLNQACAGQPVAIQCHRTAKNADDNIAVLDGLSEEINNSIFRRGHNRLGLSSALIGSGMCFSYTWFKANVGELSTAGEDKELEALLLKEHIFIRYEEDIYVMDEKVSGGDNFQRQRLRWMTAQLQCLLAMLPYVPKAFVNGNINYLDKTLQQTLVPRSILLVLITALTLLSTLVAFLTPHSTLLTTLKWWFLLAMLVVALVVAIPRRLRTRAVFSKVILVPQLVWRMLKNLLHINTRSKDFIHTTHHT